MSGFLGSGNVLFNQLVSGAFAGAIDLGNCTQFAITEKGEQVDRVSRKRGTAGQNLSTVNRKQPGEFAITWDEQGTPENVALSTHGTLSDLDQSSDTGTSFTRTLVQDKWVEIDPGVRNITSITVSGKTEGTDYVLNERLGLVKALNSGMAGSKTGTYDQGTRSGSLIVGSTTTVIRGRFILDGINEDGEEPVIVDVWDAVVMSASSFDPLSDAFATGQMTGKMNTPDASHPLGAKTGPYQIEMGIVDG